MYNNNIIILLLLVYEFLPIQFPVFTAGKSCPPDIYKKGMQKHNFTHAMCISWYYVKEQKALNNTILNTN